MFFFLLFEAILKLDKITKPSLENLLHISIALKVVVIVVKAKLVVFLVEDVFNVKTSHTNTYVQQPQTGSSQAMQLSPLTIIIYEKTLRY